MSTPSSQACPLPGGALARLLVICPDSPGIVAGVSAFLRDRKANILDLDQHASAESGCVPTLHLRLTFQVPQTNLDVQGFSMAFASEVADPFAMRFRLWPVDVKKTMVIMASKSDHCLMELLWRNERGELPATISCVIANHPDHRAKVEALGIPYHVVQTANRPKPQVEAEILELAGGPDLVVLARYMQILSGEFVRRFPGRIINIHHSFLPAFVGANPYRQAYDRGVKIIGATAHYVTEELDAGPIIDQGVTPVTHRHGVADLTRLGRDIERAVLARAVIAHLEDRVLICEGKTIVF